MSDSICPATHLDKRHIPKHPSIAGCTSSAMVYHGCHHKIHKHKEIGGSKTRPKLSRRLPCFLCFFRNVRNFSIHKKTGKPEPPLPLPQTCCFRDMSFHKCRAKLCLKAWLFRVLWHRRCSHSCSPCALL